MTTGDILEMLDERVVHRCAAEGADEGQGCAATFCVTTNPKRAATWVTNFSRMGAPSLRTPRPATNSGGFTHQNLTQRRLQTFPASRPREIGAPHP